MGISRRNIAYSCRCSPTTVVNVIQKAKAAGLSWPLLEEMTDRAIKDIIYPPTRKDDVNKALIDHESIDKEMRRHGVTMMLLWSEYCDQALAAGKEPYMYSAFCEKHRVWANKTKVVMHLEHKPGYEMQVDYVGDTAEIVDTETGEIYKVYIFAACLPFSNKVFAQGAYDTKEASWIASHIAAFNYFGGITTIITPDNLKAGVIKNTLDELILNDQYRTMAEYYGTIVMPARSCKPRDKAAVEGAVNLIEQKTLALFRDRVFFTLAEFNEALQSKVDAINAASFQKREGSRDEVFYCQEKPTLIPLPAQPFEPITRKVVTVNFTYHVTFDGQWYSVPFPT